MTNELLINSQFKTGKQKKMHFQICSEVSSLGKLSVLEFLKSKRSLDIMKRKRGAKTCQPIYLLSTSRRKRS
jgi:hypothetical protein